MGTAAEDGDAVTRPTHGGAMDIHIEPMSLRLAQLTPLQRTLIVSETVYGPMQVAGSMVVDLLSGLLAILACGLLWLAFDWCLGFAR